MTGQLYADWGTYEYADWGTYDTAQEKREALAALLSDALPEGWNVYPAPHDQPVTPFAMIAPGTPYRKPYTMGPTGAEAVALRVLLAVPRIAGPTGMDRLDAALDALTRGEAPVFEVAVDMTDASIAQALSGAQDVLVATLNVTIAS